MTHDRISFGASDAHSTSAPHPYDVFDVPECCVEPSHFSGASDARVVPEARVPHDASAPEPANENLIDWRSDDPFGLITHMLPGELRQMCEIDDGDGIKHPLKCRRAVFINARGELFLADVAGQEAVQIGERVTFADAGEIAVGVLLGASRARTAPLCVHTLALGYMAVLAEVERLRRLPRVVYCDTATVEVA
jgi:hypothetical protein